LKHSNLNISLLLKEVPRLTEKSKLFFYLFCSELIQFITSGPVIAMEILRDDAICEWKRLLGPANSGVARTDAPGSIRALFGTDGIRNAAHGPDSFASAARVRCFKNILILF
jgi:nucleoside diphosphate kinase